MVCTAEQTCVDGQCLARACGSTVCPAGSICAADAGTCTDVACTGVTCADGGACQAGRCDGLTPCTNHVKDPGETDVDCGGNCPPCGVGGHCLASTDCTTMTCGDGGSCSSSCAGGATCGTNPGSPCRLGTTICTNDMSQCVDGIDAPNGTTCGNNTVCAGGQCVACVAGQACSTNSDPCRAGSIVCPGQPLCANDAGLPAGAACGTGQVCNPQGQCIACEQDAGCASNPSAPCKSGVQSCTTGAPRCLDGTDVPNGTSCGLDKVCQVGACVSCAAGTVCNTNPTPCKRGTTVCSPSVACADNGNVAAGVACGSGQVCDGNGSCLACTAGVSCNTNPGAPCKSGITDCSTGTQRCIDSGNTSAGTTCGTGQVCNGTGACVACQAGATCSGNPSACRAGTISCTTGSPTCVDGANLTAGLNCGAGQVCDGNGFCGACVAGQSCSSNPGGACKQGVTSCTSGATQCVDGAATTAGVSCGVGQVCNGSGSCVACSAGQACVGNPNACAVGITSCTTGSQTCVDGAARAAGITCGPNQVCSGTGVCNACTSNTSCATNPNPCMTGVTNCSTGASQCVDYVNKAAGVSCGTNQVCNGSGQCQSCTAGLSCSGNPNSCAVGVTSCATGTQTCVDGASKAPGTVCGTNQVCNPSGTCAACSEGQSCGTNPNAACFTGVTSCATGVTTCVDSVQRAPGTSCGVNLVCNASGTCTACTANASCATNPSLCRNGVTSCTTGAQTCVDGTVKNAGTSCGAGQVCDGNGFCGSCTAGMACSGNPNPCYAGVTSCASGMSACVDNLASPRGTGVSCGAGLVCNASNTCVACSAGVSCATNPSICRNGITSCSTGAQVCIDDVTSKNAGLSCGSNQVCNGAGGCVACVAGQSCNTNPTACLTGVTSCSTGSQVCVDTATPKTPGTSCGTNQVCTSSGICAACTAGQACSGNPNSACFAGTTSCASGTQTCIDGTQTPAGTSCGANQVCNSAGVCTACTAGSNCSGNPSACRKGITSCTTGTQTCIDGANQPGGLTCGSNQVCDGNGFCGACTAGQACATNPNSGCFNGVTSCTTGTTTCVDGSAKAVGTTCGTNQVCNAANQCVSCLAGQGCSGNPTSCKVGVTSCQTGASTCVDSAMSVSPGTSCGANQVCNGSGSCVACTVGAACGSNPNAACKNGTTVCTSGSPACIDGSSKTAGTSCGTNLVCDGTATCVSCTAGQACASNPNLCANGVTSCSTGALQCVDNTPKPSGVSCGSNQTCDGSGNCKNSCMTPSGSIIPHGGTVTLFPSASVACGSTCTPEVRTCNNGTLSGSATNASCSVAACPCNLPWGGSIASGSTITAFQTSSVACGSSCSSEVRTCTNGALSGSFTNQSCSVAPGTRANGSACALGCSCTSGYCGQFYPDADNDGHGARNSALTGFCADNASTPPTGASLTADDCCDSESRAYPGQTNFFGTASACGGFDFNCDGSSQLGQPSGYGNLQCTAANHCPSQCIPNSSGACDLEFGCTPMGPFVMGWGVFTGTVSGGNAYTPGGVPACGATGTMVTGVTSYTSGNGNTYFGCGSQTYQVFTLAPGTVQACR